MITGALERRDTCVKNERQSLFADVRKSSFIYIYFKLVNFELKILIYQLIKG